MKEATTTNHPERLRGKAVAEVLAGSWRKSASAISGHQLEMAMPILLKAGAGGLAWCGIRNSGLTASETGELLHAAYRMQSLRSALHKRNLGRVIPALRAAGVDPLLVKGWAVARLYPEPGMRPYLDLDICVRPNEYDRARDVLSNGDLQDCVVDLHSGFGKFYTRQTEEVFSRSRLVKLGDLEVKVLGPEDDLRFLCLHLLRHGAVQPLWLCDVCVVLEGLSKDFDWDLCLTGRRRVAEWVGCAIGLAHHLLGASVAGTPVEYLTSRLPGWLVPVVLEEWGKPLKTLPRLVASLSDVGGWPRNLPGDLLNHWPNPIEATMTVGGAFNELPRLPYQAGHVLSRAASFVGQLISGKAGDLLQRA